MADPQRIASALQYQQERSGGRDWRYYAGPHLSKGLDNLGGLASALINYVGPGADVKGMVDDSAETMEALRSGDYPSAAANFGTAAAALPMMFLPGTVKGVEEAVKGAGAGVSRASKVGFIYDPPTRPQRPFDADYPKGARADDTGRITHDIEGRPLQVGGRIVGRRVAGGADEALPSTEFDAIATEGTGRPPATAPLPGNDMGRVSVNPYSRLPESLSLSNRLTADELPKVYGHEIGHVVDQLAGEIPTENISRQLSKLYNTLNNPNRAGAEAATHGRPFVPESLGYKGKDVPREYLAEAIRAYMADPNYIKTEAPQVAKAIRNAVNKNPEIRKIIQFNSVLATFGVGAGAGALADKDSGK